jgi:hypothetical protein
VNLLLFGEDRTPAQHLALPIAPGAKSQKSFKQILGRDEVLFEPMAVPQDSGVEGAQQLPVAPIESGCAHPVPVHFCDRSEMEGKMETGIIFILFYWALTSLTAEGGVLPSSTAVTFSSCSNWRVQTKAKAKTSICVVRVRVRWCVRVCACAVSPVCGAVSGETYEHVGSGFDRGGADVRQERDRWECEQVRMHLGLVLYRHTTNREQSAVSWLGAAW